MRGPVRGVGAVAGVSALVCATVLGGSVPAHSAPIPGTPGGNLVEDYVGAPAEPQPVPGAPGAQHPFMAPAGQNGMHGDAASSGTHPASGPLGHAPQVTSESMGLVGGECATAAFDSRGLLVTVCGSVQGFTLKLLDPHTLATLAEHDLGQRPSTVTALATLDPGKIFNDTSGGAYFYLDEQDRVVLADPRQHVLRIAHVRDAEGRWEFRVTDDWDLTPYVPHDCATYTNPYPSGDCDPVTSVLPDWQGRLWWVSRAGVVGTIAPESGVIRTVSLGGEQIQNSFSVSADGVSIVSDHALYQFRADVDGTPRQVWRHAYDRGAGTKPGSLSQGSGTTPTLLGEDYVAITDNADDRINVEVYRRDERIPDEQRKVCSVPVFGSGESATDNSLVGWGDSLVVENNYGYANAGTLTFGRSVVGGITRVDVRPDGSGCDLVWESAERSPSTVPKLSRANGLLYFYTKEPDRRGIDAWYLTAVDFRTGATRWKVLTGTGPAYDNQWAPITIGPDGTAYVGVFNGILAVRDRD